jgi:hypothetical protein
VCLEIRVEVDPGERSSLEAAATAASAGGLVVKMVHVSRWPWARQRPARAYVSDGTACACSLLTDRADWSAEVWDMRPDILEPLARCLATLAEHGPQQLTVQAAWVGEEPLNDVRLRPTDLADLARASRLGTRTRYIVERRGGPTSGCS